MFNYCSKWKKECYNVLCSIWRPQENQTYNNCPYLKIMKNKLVTCFRNTLGRYSHFKIFNILPSIAIIHDKASFFDDTDICNETSISFSFLCWEYTINYYWNRKLYLNTER